MKIEHTEGRLGQLEQLELIEMLRRVVRIIDTNEDKIYVGEVLDLAVQARALLTRSTDRRE